MNILADIIIVLLIIGGAFFFLVSTVGLIRMPDPFSRIQATGKSDTLGAALILLALVINYGISLISIKLLITIAFIWITSPTAAHIIAKAEINKNNNRNV